MTARFPFGNCSIDAPLAIAGFATEASAWAETSSPFRAVTCRCNGKPFKVIGLRLSNGLVSRTPKTQRADHKSGRVQILRHQYVQRVSSWDRASETSKATFPDATIDPTYGARMAKIIEPQTPRGMVVLWVLYWGTSTAMDGLVGWTQMQRTRPSRTPLRWLKKPTATAMFFLDPDNEGMSPFTDALLDRRRACRRSLDHDRVQ